MKKLLTALSCLCMCTAANAQEPIIQTKYTADPAPYVHGDTIFLYVTHDEDDAEGFKMFDWLLYTSTDMVNWTDHGAVASLDDFKWYEGKNGAWAEQVIERNGKWYMYCPIHGHGIGVLVADSPYGPFKDPIGKPLVWQKEHWNDIDPTVFIDDDGQAYMYWGNPKLYCALLNEDMISLKSDAMQLHDVPEHYQEGPWFYKRNGKYYLAYASTCCPEGLGYAMSDNALGPWKFKGYVMAPTDRTRGNHPGIIDYKGKSYGFGLNYDLKNLTIKEHKERRNVGAFPLTYNADGTIQESPYFKDVKVEQIGTFNPYQTVQAETMAWGFGLKTVKRGVEDIYVTDINNGEYLLVKGVNFGSKMAHKFIISAASTVGGKIEIHIDSQKGKTIGTVNIGATGSETLFKEFQANIAAVSGVHDLYFVFKGAKDKNLFNLDWWTFTGVPAGYVTQERVVENGGQGQYKAIMREIADLKAHTVFYPQDLSQFGGKNQLPVLVWANGACTNSPWEHYLFLNEIASHGYIVIATGYFPVDDKPYNGKMSTPQQQIESIDWIIAQSKDKNSPFFGKVDTKNICVSGMSCGGLQSLINCADKRISALMICNSGLFIDPSIAMPNMPMPSKDKLKEIHTPVIYILGGKSDIAYNNGMDDFHRIKHVPAFAANYPVGHGGTYRQPHGGEFSVPAVAWLDWQLKGSEEAAKMFKGKDCGLSKRKGWTVEKNNKIDE
ncbi:MAG: family 43 glycosylhydrolase [Bacteroidaceae bacterium]|nr:family 43 glycosylhydrolase [Bacteroidaceae bacterium]